jgi:P-type Cu2+ transporter
VIAGTVNEAGSLRVAVTGTGERTTLAGIMRLVDQAQSSRSRAQALADRAAFWLTLIALGAGAATLVAWLAAGAEGAFAVERLVTVLVIACPHALGPRTDSWCETGADSRRRGCLIPWCSIRRARSH